MNRAQQIVRSKSFDSAALQNLVATSFKDLRYALSLNHSLSRDVWFQLYTKRPTIPYETALNLVRHTLDGDQIKHVLSLERRASVVGTMICRTLVSPEQARVLLDAGRISSGVANDWLGVNKVPLEVAGSVLALANGPSSLGWLAKNHHDLTQDFILEQVRRIGLHPREQNRTDVIRSLQVLMENYPALIDVATSVTSPALRKAAAGSRHLTPAQASALAGEVATKELPDWRDVASVSGLCILLRNPAVSPLFAQKVWSLQGRVANPQHLLSVRMAAESRFANLPDQLTLPYQEVSDPQQLEYLFQWAHPLDSHGRLRVDDLRALLENRVMSSQLALQLWERIILSVTDSCPEEGTPLRVALEGFLNFYQIAGGSENFTANQERLAREHQLRQELLKAGFPLKRLQDPEAHQKRDDQGECVSPVENWPLAVLEKSDPEAVSYLLETIEEDPKLFELLLGLVNSFEGTLSEVTQLVQSL